MEKIKENNLYEKQYRKSEARENFKHLNSSNRKRIASYDKKEYEPRNNDSSYNQDKITKDFKRFLISTVLVASVVIVKILDFGITNTLETKITSLLRNTSTIDTKISSMVVLLGEKVGINIDEVSSDNIEEETTVEKTTVEKTTTTDENIIETETVSDEQISDFYIDEEVLESVFEDEKK